MLRSILCTEFCAKKSQNRWPKYSHMQENKKVLFSCPSFLEKQTTMYNLVQCTFFVSKPKKLWEELYQRGSPGRIFAICCCHKWFSILPDWLQFLLFAKLLWFFIFKSRMLVIFRILEILAVSMSWISVDVTRSASFHHRQHTDESSE